MTRVALPDGIRLIDVELFGVKEVSCSYWVDAAEPALIETGPATVFEILTRSVPGPPAHIVLTHIHLDHAGGAGHVAKVWPDATIWVHTAGAPHVIDPTKLISSARRLYGDKLDEWFGEPQPVPEDRVRAVDEGDCIDLGDRQLKIFHTPGHASHEVTIQDSHTGCVFTGDTAGIFTGESMHRPATPPPEFDLPLAISSIERVKSLNPSAICFTHYGAGSLETLDVAIADLRRWDEVLRPIKDSSIEELIEAIDTLDPSGRPPLGTLMPTEVNVLGFARYYKNFT